jgi:thiamine monophosphate synthase
MEADYSLYLVTDSKASILGNKDLVAVVEAALAGGVTVSNIETKSVTLQILSQLLESCMLSQGSTMYLS